MDNILYSTGCPKCEVLKKKLDAKNIDYVIINNVDEILALGIKQVPVLSVRGELKDFREAVNWINEEGEK